MHTLCALGPRQSCHIRKHWTSLFQSAAWYHWLTMVTIQEFHKSQQLLDCTLCLQAHAPTGKEIRKTPDPSRYFHNSSPTGRDIKQWLPLSRNWMSCSSSGCSGCVKHLVPPPPPSGTAGSDEAPLVTRTPLHQSENSAAAGELQGKDTTGNDSAQGSGSALANSCRSCWGREALAAAAWHLLNLKGQHDEQIQDIGRWMHFVSIPPNLEETDILHCDMLWTMCSQKWCTELCMLYQYQQPAFTDSAYYRNSVCCTASSGEPSKSTPAALAIKLKL